MIYAQCREEMRVWQSICSCLGVGLCCPISIGNTYRPCVEDFPWPPCCSTACRHMGINASARASAYIYNTPEEVNTFVEALEDTIKFFKEIS